MRRISAARLIQQIPEVKTKIQNGSLKLTVVAQAQSFFKKEEAATGNRLKPEQKKQILQNLENKSSREAELELVKLRPESVKHSESLRPLTEEFTEIKFVITSDLKTKITELQNLLSHQLPNKNISSLMQLLVEKLYNDFKQKGKIAEPTSQIKYKPTHSGAGVAQFAPNRKINYPVVKYNQGNNPIQSSRKTRDKTESVSPASKTLQCNRQNESAERASENLKLNLSTNTSTNSENESNINTNTSAGGGLTRNQSPSRYIATKVRKFIWSRDNGSCQYQNTITGKKCESKHQLQIDHIHRFADGGSHKPENLRLLCRAHNNWRG
jgi:5-methylcytosine-specific restriction endonuclease McrA